MVGAKFQTHERAGRVTSPRALQRCALGQPHAGSHRWRWIALLSLFVPLSFVLVQCGRAPNAGTLAANSQAPRETLSTTASRNLSSGIASRRASESLAQRQSVDAPPKRTAQAAARPLPGRLAGADGALPAPAPKEDLTTLVSLKSSAFPYLGNNPRTDAAVPERFQGRAPRPSQLRRPGLLAGRDLQRQPRADACP